MYQKVKSVERAPSSRVVYMSPKGKVLTQNKARELSEKKKEAAEEAPAEPEPTKEELLLAEIRDLLKEQNK